jgi:hypothetical protein
VLEEPAVARFHEAWNNFNVDEDEIV